MANSAILAIRVVTDAARAAKDVDTLGDSTGKLEGRARKASAAAKVVAVGIAGLATASVKAASDQQQAFGAVDSVFGKQAAAVKKLAGSAANSLGLARSDYANLAAILGSQLGNLGVAQDQLVGKTDDLIKRGGDLAATFGGTTSDAVSALSALLRGETDPIERYGVSIKQADIQARLAAKGQDKLTGKQLQAAKTQATLELLNKQTAKAAGQRARESGSAEAAQQKAMANLKNASASLGAVLLPIVAAIGSRLAAMAGFVDKNRTAFTILIGVIAALAAATIATNGAIAAYTTVSRIARAATIVYRNAQLALNLALMANPIGLVIAAIVILVGLFVLAYKKSDRFRALVNAVGRAGKTAIQWIVDKVRELVSWVGSRIPGAFALMQRLAVAYIRLVTLPIRTVITVVSSLIVWVRDRLPGAFAAAKNAAQNVGGKLLSPFRALLGVIQDIVDWIKKIKLPSLKGIGKIAGGLNPFGFASFGPSGPGAPPSFGPAGGPPAAPGLMARGLVGARSLVGGGGSSSRSSAGGAGVVIYVQGALDPDAVAKQIEKILGRRRVRIGSVSSG